LATASPSWTGGSGFYPCLDQIAEAIHMHGASAALRDTAAAFRAGELFEIANDPQQRCIRIAVKSLRLSIESESNDGRASNLAGADWPRKGRKRIP
jgi:hypothetical protein